MEYLQAHKLDLLSDGIILLQIKTNEIHLTALSNECEKYTKHNTQYFKRIILH